MKFEVKNRFTGEVQFTAEIECDKDASTSIKLGLAVKWAIKNKADLRSADLRFADLRSADLRSADLRSADLRFADLRSADLRFADLRFADLRSADLRSADLRSADLRSADLRSADLRFANLSSANLRSADLAVIHTDIWTVYIVKNDVRIGCQYHTLTKWKKFTNKEISEMSGEALQWWKRWKPVIVATHNALGVKK